MEAKDTVIPIESHGHSVYCPQCGAEQGIETYVEVVREEQAEISFKAGELEGYAKGFADGVNNGFKAGIREVGKFMDGQVSPFGSDLVTIPYAWIVNLKEGELPDKEVTNG